jgi:circadian clock protein KaiB
MPGNKESPSAVKFASRSRGARKDKYVLRLYIAGTSARSSRAVANIRQICERNLNGRYDLEVIDIYQRPALARGEQIIAAPTLVKMLPAPLRRFIGDLSDTQRILIGMDLIANDGNP